MFDWVVNLKHLQSILLEYNLAKVLTKLTMLRYFRENLNFSILVKLEYWNLKLESFNQMVKKVITIEAKAALRSCSNTEEMNQNCLCGNRPANFIIA